MDASLLLEYVGTYGWEYFKVYPGLYRGIVTRVDDPQKRGRVQARCLGVGHREAPNVWIKPAFFGAGSNRGSFWPPEVGDSVYVCFRQGNPGRPEAYFGGWFGRDEVPEEFAYTDDRPETRGMVTRGGHRLVFKDTAGEQAIEIVWHKPASGDEGLSQPSPSRTLSDPEQGAQSSDRSSGDSASIKITKDGNVEIKDKESQTVVLDAANKKIVVSDANGNVVTLDSSGATIKSDAINLGDGADSEAMRFTDWQRWAVAHTHPTSWGPSGPPIQPIPPTVKSPIVKLK